MTADAQQTDARHDQGGAATARHDQGGAAAAGEAAGIKRKATETSEEEDEPKIVPFKSLANDPFIRSSKRLLEVLRSLHRNEEAMLFSNRAGDLTFMLRSTSEITDELMSFEVVVPHDPDDDPGDFLKRVLTDEYACMEDEGGDYVFESMVVTRDATEDDVEDVVDTINFFYDVHICECHANLVKTDDAHGICFSCHLQGDDKETTGHACVICSEEIRTRRGLVSMACCRQHLHRKCYNLWRGKKTTNCPVCRT